jgi:hypothetical protein
MPDRTEALIWPSEVRDAVRLRSTAITAALDDMRVANEPFARGWVDIRSGTVNLYVAEPGCLHILRGPEDRQVVDATKARESSCEYRALPITVDWRYTVLIKWTFDAAHGPRLVRKWMFNTAADEENVFFERVEDGPGDDPSDFARHLGTLTAHVSS